MDGIINLNKPAGITSHRAVAGVRLLAPGVKVGHAGTLDPAATGVLPVCLGRATRVVEYLVELRKGYRAAINLGVTTTTGDADGTVVSRSALPLLERVDIEELLHSLAGLQQQETPAYAAAKYRGRPLYEYARRGEAVPVKKRTVRIYRLELLAFCPETAPQIICEVECSKGTYIRVLAEEIGRRLGCGAHLHALERLFVGPFEIGSAVSPGDLERAAFGGTFRDLLLPMDRVLTHFESLTVSDTVVDDLRAGRAVPWSRLEQGGLDAPPPGPRPLRIYDSRGHFKALARIHEGDGEDILKTVKFLAP